MKIRLNFDDGEYTDSLIVEDEDEDTCIAMAIEESNRRGWSSKNSWSEEI